VLRTSAIAARWAARSFRDPSTRSVGGSSVGSVVQPFVRSLVACVAILALGAASAATPGGAAEPAPNAEAASGADASVASNALLDPYPKAAAAYLVVVDGVELWGHAPDRALPPASLTKLMTALVLLERWEPEAIVEVGPTAAAATGSRIGLRAGDRLRFADAFDALLVASANDACLALAEHAAGSVERFVERMNRKAGALALRATRFRNPCGLDAPDHRSTARDLHRLARHAMAQPELARAVAQPEVVLQTLAGRHLAKPSSNLLLGRVPGAVGIKSGFTRRAGKCLAALVRRGGDEVTVILLDAPDRWWAASILIEDAFAALDAARR
jgi:D-alanyl-D-alanine carboxypeptidase (penicillin-binding protein 5/6)